MPVICRQVLKVLEQLAPSQLSEEWDNTGLLIGDPSAEVEGIMLCLDMSVSVLEEALEKGANLVISHHPFLFKPLKTLRFDSPLGQLLQKIIKEELQVIALHTNFDHAGEGVSAQLAKKLGLVDVKVLQPKYRETLYKLTVFVPREHESAVRQAIGDAGAGHIGNYSHCTFRVSGTGTFLPLEGTNPFIGAKGRMEEVEEFRLETIVPESRLGKVLDAMLAVHPYEEVAYDLYPLANQIKEHGLGRIGRLPEPVSLARFAEQVKKRLALPAVRLAGNPEQIIATVAVCGGSGKHLIAAAASAGADALVTGELGHHEAQVARDLNLALVDAGHFGTEIVSLPFLAAYLERALDAQQNNIFVAMAVTEKDPWQIV